MKILEITNYSAGICGVWARVRQEATLLAEKGHEVIVFSTRYTKGSSLIAKEKERIDHLAVYRFAAKKLGGESYMQWDWDAFTKKAIELKPQVIIAHSYRHQHTLAALDIAKKVGAKCFLVTHAPFVEGNSTRSLLGKIAVSYYDSFLGPSRKLNQFDKIIAITKWELPYLEKLGVRKDKIVYLPNGLLDEFFGQKKASESEKILFLGRLSPIKDLETLIEATALLPAITLEIVGPAEEDYLAKLQTLVALKKLEKRVKFLPAVHDLKEKIKLLDSAKIFVLPSKREAMPQALIEAMSREKIVIASDNPGSRDLIQDGVNGYLFPVGDSKTLAKKISLALKSTQARIKKQARSSVEQFRWNKIITRLNDLIIS